MKGSNLLLLLLLELAVSFMTPRQSDTFAYRAEKMSVTEALS